MLLPRREVLSLGIRSAAMLGILRHVSACRSPDAEPAGYSDAFAQVRDRYFLRVLELNPVTATYLGGDGYDPSLAEINGKLRDFAPAAIAAELAYFREIEQAMAGLDPATEGSAERVDRSVMAAQIAFLLRQYGDRRHQERAVDTYVAEPFRGVDWQIQQMTPAGDDLGSEAEWQLVARRVAAVPAYLATARANLEAGIAAGNVPDRRMVQRDGIAGSTANARYFRETLPAEAARHLGQRPFAESAFTSIGEAGEAAAAAFESFAEFLSGAYAAAAGTDHYAAGEDDYGWRVRNCLAVDRTPAELWDYGAQQVALYEEKIFAVAAQVAEAAGLSLPFGTDAERRASMRQVLAHLGQDSPRNDDELLQWYVDTGKRAVEYGRRKELFDVPTDYQLDVVATPPVLRSAIDAAYYPAPPFKETGVGRFYLSPTGNDPAALAQNNRASVATTAVHEGFPGHDWHYKYMNQHADEIANIRWLTPGAVEDSSSMWEDSMAAEGWGLYAEELMAEGGQGEPFGFYQPAEYLYMLQGQLMRAVRVRVDVGIHTGRMTFDEAVDYFAARVEFVPEASTRRASDPVANAAYETADRAIYRYSKWPTQAITYNLGKNEIVALREAERAKAGAGFDARAFHEWLMRQGTVPVGHYA
ncbi:MAG TPA: DUF885 domain-containing protein [Gemmatimonadales bacterium]|nr:DUF885 domain-containing protein [Gemmatimonadales bacterium]